MHSCWQWPSKLTDAIFLERVFALKSGGAFPWAKLHKHGYLEIRAALRLVITCRLRSGSLGHSTNSTTIRTEALLLSLFPDQWYKAFIPSKEALWVWLLLDPWKALLPLFLWACFLLSYPQTSFPSSFSTGRLLNSPFPFLQSFSYRIPICSSFPSLYCKVYSCCSCSNLLQLVCNSLETWHPKQIFQLKFHTGYPVWSILYSLSLARAAQHCSPVLWHNQIPSNRTAMVWSPAGSQCPAIRSVGSWLFLLKPRSLHLSALQFSPSLFTDIIAVSSSDQ